MAGGVGMGMRGVKWKVEDEDRARGVQRAGNRKTGGLRLGKKTTAPATGGAATWLWMWGCQGT
jgi:hypothetical protein